jgi:hypothetical protein
MAPLIRERERRAIVSDHQAACKDWGQGGLPCQKVVCPCRVGFSSHPLLSHHFRLSPAQHDGGEVLTGGMEVCPQTAQIGLIGCFLTGFTLDMVWFIRSWTFQELFRVESDPERLL